LPCWPWCTGPPLKRIARPQYIGIDLTGPSMATQLKPFRPNIIVHAAAKLPPSYQSQETQDAGAINRVIDDAVIDWAKAIGAKLIFLSTTAVYGHPGQAAMQEASPASPSGGYAKQKLHSENLAREALGDWAVSLRISAPYGYRQSTRTVLQLFLEKALANQDLTYHGSGSRGQDFVAVEDVAHAVLAACNSNPLNGVFNITGGRTVSMLELANIVVNCLPGCRSKVIPSGKADPQEGFWPAYDIQKAYRQLGWRPKTGLEQGIARLANQLREGGH
jgi:UDP-glucose 4-epimerase